MHKSSIVVRKKGRYKHLSLPPGFNAEEFLQKFARKIESAGEMLTRDNTVALDTRRATLRPNSYDAQTRTIEAVIATGNPVQRNGYVEILDVNGADLSAMRGANVLNNHQQRSLADVLGTVEDAWHEEGVGIVARLRLSDRPEVASLVRAIGAGDLSPVSIGYEVGEWRDGTDASGARTRTAVKWRPREVSFVAVSADPAARTRNATATIIELGRRAGVEQRTIDGLLTRGATIEQANEVILNELMTRGAAPLRTGHNEFTMENSEAFQRAVGEALYMRGAPNHQPSGAARQYVGHTTLDVARDCCRRSGISTTGLSAHALIERALATSDFPLILADTVGRTLRSSYKQPTSGIRLLARQTTMNDFRAKSRLMLDSSGVTLEKVNEHGEFKNGSLVESGESYRLNTYGKIIALTRQAIINDDLGALVDLARRFGVAAMAFEAQELVNLLQANSGVGPTMSDGNAMHHTAHGNIAASGAAPSETTLSAARLAMRKQTGPGGGLIEVTPRYLLVPSELETASEKLLSTINAAATADVNVFGGKLQLIVEPRLTSATRWWLFASPDEVESLEYSHLAGAPGPQISTQVGFRVDGVETRVSLDFGCGAVDFRGSYCNAGA